MKESDYLQENPEVIKSLKKLPIMGSLEDKHVKGLAKLCKIVQFEKGECIFEEGGFDQHIFFIISGKVKISKKGVDIGEIRKQGDVFGEMGIIEEKERSASVVADDTTNCLKMDLSYIDRLPENERDSCLYVIYKVFTVLLAGRLRATSEELMLTKAALARVKS